MINYLYFRVRHCELVLISTWVSFVLSSLLCVDVALCVFTFDI